MRDVSIFTAAVNRLYRQVLLMIGRGRVTLVDDTQVIQYAQVRLGQNELRDGVPRVQEYGFTSNPPVGTDCILAFVAGDRSNGCIIASNNQTYRLKNLPTGDVALYDMFGNKVHLSQQGVQIDDCNDNHIIMSSTGIAWVDKSNNNIYSSPNGIFINSIKNLNLTAININLHSTLTLRYDAGGNGTYYSISSRSDYVIGSIDNSFNLNPPQIP